MSESSALNTFIELIKRSENEITKKILSIRDEMKEKEIEGLMFYFQKLLSECNQHIANQYDLLYGNACLLSLLLQKNILDKSDVLEIIHLVYCFAMDRFYNRMSKIQITGILSAIQSAMDQTNVESYLEFFRTNSIVSVNVEGYLKLVISGMAKESFNKTNCANEDIISLLIAIFLFASNTLNNTEMDIFLKSFLQNTFASCPSIAPIQKSGMSSLQDHNFTNNFQSYSNQSHPCTRHNEAQSIPRPEYAHPQMFGNGIQNMINAPNCFYPTNYTQNTWQTQAPMNVPSGCVSQPNFGMSMPFFSNENNVVQAPPSYNGFATTNVSQASVPIPNTGMSMPCFPSYNNNPHPTVMQPRSQNGFSTTHLPQASVRTPNMGMSVPCFPSYNNNHNCVVRQNELPQGNPPSTVFIQRSNRSNMDNSSATSSLQTSSFLGSMNALNINECQQLRVVDVLIEQFLTNGMRNTYRPLPECGFFKNNKFATREQAQLALTHYFPCPTGDYTINSSKTYKKGRTIFECPCEGDRKVWVAILGDIRHVQNGRTKIVVAPFRIAVPLPCQLESHVIARWKSLARCEGRDPGPLPRDGNNSCFQIAFPTQKNPTNTQKSKLLRSTPASNLKLKINGKHPPSEHGSRKKFQKKLQKSNQSPPIVRPPPSTTNLTNRLPNVGQTEDDHDNGSFTPNIKEENCTVFINQEARCPNSSSELSTAGKIDENHTGAIDDCNGNIHDDDIHAKIEQANAESLPGIYKDSHHGDDSSTDTDLSSDTHPDSSASPCIVRRQACSSTMKQNECLKGKQQSVPADVTKLENLYSNDSESTFQPKAKLKEEQDKGDHYPPLIDGNGKSEESTEENTDGERKRDHSHMLEEGQSQVPTPQRRNSSKVNFFLYMLSPSLYV
jgi:hypothetical protein